MRASALTRSLVADHEADAPARHVVALGHGEEFDGDVARARHLHDRRRLPAVEADVGVGEVVHDVDAVFPRQLDDLLEERQLDALRGRIRREIDDEHLRLREAHLDRVLEFGEEIHARRQRHLPDVGAGDHRTVDVDRIAGIRHQHGVAAPERGQRQMRDAFLGADGDDRLGLRVELDTPPPLIPLADGATQTRNTARHGVAVRIGTLHGLDQLGHDVRRRRTVGVAHAEVDDVLATAAGGHLEFGGDVEDVRRQALEAREFDSGGGGHAGLSIVSARNRPSDVESGTKL